jgi:hypothetical protein
MKRILFVSILIFSPFAYAGKDLDSAAVQLSVASGNVTQQRQTIESKLTQIEYTELTPANRNVLTNRFIDLESGAVKGEDALAAEKQINEILAKTFADSKISCTYETPLGTNMKKRVCMTAAARQRTFEATQREIQMKKTPSSPYTSQ